MRIKVKKFWLSDGTIVLEVRDHDSPLEPNSAAVAWDNRIRATIGLKVIHRSTYPRNTPKAEIKTAMKSLKILHEIKIGGV